MSWTCDGGTDGATVEKIEPTKPLDAFSDDGILIEEESLEDPATNSRRSSEVEDGVSIPNGNMKG